MTDESENEAPEDPAAPGAQWVVSCPRHGARAHLYLEGLKASTPDLQHCSLKPGEFPPSCDQACMASFKFQSVEPDEPEDMEDTLVDD